MAFWRTLFRPILGTFLVGTIVALAFASGYIAGSRDTVAAHPVVQAATVDRTEPTPHPLAPSRPPANLAEQFRVFWEAWNFVEQEYFRRPVDRTDLVYGAIRGMLQALGDPHSTFLDPAANRIAKSLLAGAFEGIGATVEMQDGQVTIVTPLPDGPAARAGLEPGDIVLRVNGQDITGLTLPEVVARIRGAAGTPVRLTIMRPQSGTNDPFDVEIVRARIKLKSVSTQPVVDGVGYIKISTFASATLAPLKAALREVRQQDARGLILDLRDNPGGLLSVAVKVAGQFLPEGTVIVQEQSADGSVQMYKAQGDGLATDIALVVLVNRGSASGAEIVAGALADHGRALLVGETTYGKGTVQLPRDLSDGSAIRLTVAQWLTPKGELIQGRGITPAIEVVQTREDRARGHDPVLARAREQFRLSPVLSQDGVSVAAEHTEFVLPGGTDGPR